MDNITFVESEPFETTIERLAEIAYTTYCAAVGGKAWNGDPLPTWAEFSTDETKAKQADGWRKAAEAIYNIV